MSSSNSFSISPPKPFNGENYQIWAVKMKVFLQSQDLWSVIAEEHVPRALPANPTLNQLRQHGEDAVRPYKALAAIHASVSEGVLARILTCTTGKEAWDKLKEMFQGSAGNQRMRVLNLWREFNLLQMKDSESIKDYVDRLLKVVNQMHLLQEDLPDKRIIEKILVSVPERFEAKISSLEDSKDLTTLTLEELVSSLQAQEQRRAMRQEEQVEGALLMNSKVKGKQVSSSGAACKSNGDKKGKDKKKGDKVKKEFPPCIHCSKVSHSEEFCWFRPGYRCKHCNFPGHADKMCKKKSTKQQAQVTTDDVQQEERLFSATCQSVLHEDDVWLLDSACTQHMTPNKKLFEQLDGSHSTKVKIGDGSYMESKGKGLVAVNTLSGTKYITDVLYIPDLCQNLLSLGQMLEQKYVLHFENKQCVISDKAGIEVMMVQMRNRCFPIEVKPGEKSFSACVHDSKLWHARLGHFNYTTLSRMHLDDLVKDLPVIKMLKDVCEVCEYGKQTRLPFGDRSWKSSQKLQLLHTDVCGPMSTPSLNGSKYFVLFVDDFTRFAWIYFMKNKSEVFESFVKFKQMAENQSGCKIKALRSDNGAEYTSNKFQGFCEQHGIAQQFTVPRTPQQNGVSERKNRSILEMARCLLFQKKLPKMFWAEATSTAVYLLNLLPTKALSGITPREAWTGCKPSVQHLRVFGCLCYTHVHEQLRSKLDQRAEKCIFLGYAFNAKGYRVFNPITDKFFVCRDLTFDEHAVWDWNNQLPQQKKEVADFDDPPVRGTRTLHEVYQRCNLTIQDPATYEEAVKDQGWVAAMEEEINMIESSQTWELVDKPLAKRVIGVKWIYRTKLNPDGSINKLKARLVVKGYSQQPGVDFNETFAPVARHDTIRMLVALAAKQGWKIWHLDVKSAFLNGYVEEEIYVNQPEGFVFPGDEDKVYRLHKALYGLKQAPRAWYNRIDAYLIDQGFTRSESEATLYVKRVQGGVELILSLYVDDLLVTGGDEVAVENFKLKMTKEFEMTDLGLMKYFLGLEIHQKLEGIFLSQKKFALDILKKFHLDEAKSVPTPLIVNIKLSKEDDSKVADEKLFRSIIGSLLYLTASRPDIMFAASLLSRFMHSPKHTHLVAAKRILRYVKGTTDFGITYSRLEGSDLQGYCDSDWAGSVDDSKSTSGYVFSFGSGAFAWKSKKQEVVAQSSSEAEYIAAAEANNQALWFRKLLIDLGMEQKSPTKLFVDNKSAIAIAENPVQHGRTKHISVKFHAIREAIKSHDIKLIHCSTEDQLADVLTKSLAKNKFEDIRMKLGVSKLNLKEEC